MKVIFDLVRDGTQVVYPDDKALFSDTELREDLTPVKVVASYSGGKNLEVYDPQFYPRTPHLGTQITRLAFLNRLTDAEAVSIDLASIGETQEAATVRRVMSKVNAAKFIDLADPDTVNGINYLLSAGLLTAERGNEILTAPVQEKELP